MIATNSCLVPNIISIYLAYKAKFQEKNFKKMNGSLLAFLEILKTKSQFSLCFQTILNF